MAKARKKKSKMATTIKRSRVARAKPAWRKPTAERGRTSPADLLTPTIRARELFWSNVVREIMLSLWAASERANTEGGGQSEASSDDPAEHEKRVPLAPDAHTPRGNLLDGRFSVVTNTGLRVPIAQVQPVFGCGVLGKQNREHWLSQAVECTVFQIRTPQGEVFTLPVHAVRAFHSLSEDAMEQLGQAARASEEEAQHAPFGFAAYTSLARSASTPPEVGEVDPRWIHASE